MKPIAIGLASAFFTLQAASVAFGGSVDLGGLGGIHIDDTGVHVGGADGVHVDDGGVQVGGPGGVSVENYDRDAVVTNLGARKVGDALVVNLQNDILFDFNSAQITPKASESLKQLAYLIQQDRKGMVVIRGHADAVGDDAYNVKLSKKRADAVAAWLKELTGLNRETFLTQGLGEAYPVAANTTSDGSDDPEGRAKNRRVEVVIQTVSGAQIPEPSAVIQIAPSH